MTVLGDITDRRGRTPLGWAAEPLDGAERVLAIGATGPVPAGWLALGRTFRADPCALPLRRNAVDGLCLLLALAGLPDPDGVFAEVRRVLRPGGTLVVLTPSAAVRTPAELPLRALHRDGWRHRSALDRAGWLLAAADFAVMRDDRVAFSVPVTPALPTELAAAGVWPPAPPAAATARLLRAGRCPVPLRRLVARR